MYIIANKDGNPIIEEIFSWVSVLRLGDVISVRVCGNEAFLRVDGTYVLEPNKYNIDNYFNLGFGVVYKDPNQYNLIDKEGNWLLDKPAFTIHVPRLTKRSQSPCELIIYDTPKTCYLYSLKEHRFKPTMFKDFNCYGDVTYFLIKPNDNFIVYDIFSGKQILDGYGIKKGYNRNSGLNWFKMDDGKLYALYIDGSIVDIDSGETVWENPYE